MVHFGYSRCQVNHQSEQSNMTDALAVYDSLRKE